MNLVLDIGNTRVKIAVFKGKAMEHVSYFKLENINSIIDFLNNQHAEKAIVSSVVENTEAITELLKHRLSVVVEFTSTTKIPIKNLYQTAHSLGNDRIPPLISAQQQHPNCNILVIDTGTCIKYNFMNKEGEYLGGAISPGLNMRFKALHTFTSRLPLVEPDIDFNKLIGTTSVESILAGVQTATVAEVNEMVNQYMQQYPTVKVFLTGGDYTFFEKRLKNPIFVDPNMILKGLNLILNYNA